MGKRVDVFFFISASLLLFASACSSTPNLQSESEKVGLNKNIKYESLKDSRDGQTYKTVQMGNRVWMAENLRFKAPESFCYDDKTANCDKYGRLYTWAAAMESCPAGWYLPTDVDWTQLLAIAGGQPTAGKSLKSANGWLSLGNGSDDHGFSALPGGIKFDNGSYKIDGGSAFFWSSFEDNSENAFGLNLHYYSDRAELNSNLKKNGFSVRCVKGRMPELSHNDSSFTDARDGQTYRIVKIGSQTWMAQNLNFKTESSSCFGDADSNCTKYGRLYSWPDAMDSAAVFSTNGKNCGSSLDERGKCSPRFPVRGVCPLGWHLPSLEEWKTLFVAVGGKKWYRDGFLRAGKSLKSKELWKGSDKKVYVEEVKRNDVVYRDKLKEPISVVGSDDYGFSALPGGYKESVWGYKVKGVKGLFWTSNQSNSSFTNDIFFNYDDAIAFYGVSRLEYSLSVRCVKDN